MNRIQSKNHIIGTYEINKVYVSCQDDKKYIIEYGYHRLSHFDRSACIIIISLNMNNTFQFSFQIEQLLSTMYFHWSNFSMMWFNFR